MDTAYIKIRTLELYEQLPQNKLDRIDRVDIRDEIIELNYSFFQYLAAHMYIKNSCVDYDDKLQSTLYNFCRFWWHYKWDGTGSESKTSNFKGSSGNSNGYRSDLSFTTFFKPRLTSAVRDSLSEISYSTRRTTLCKIGKILDKPWTQVTLEDLSNVKDIDPIDMNIARQVLDPNCRISFEYESVIHPTDIGRESYIDTISKKDDYNSIEEMLIHEIIEKEDKLTNAELKHLADILDLDYSELLEIYPKALDTLAEHLRESINEYNMES